MFLLGGNANGRQFVALAIQVTAQAQAQGAGIELVGLAPAVEGDGGDQDALRAGADQLAMEHEAEAARLLHAINGVSFADPLFDLGDELIGRELARRFGQLMIVLHHRHDELQMHVQA